MRLPVRVRILLLVALVAGAAALVFTPRLSERSGPPSTGDVARAAHANRYRPTRDRVPSALATNPGRPWGDYVGSTACKDCHPKDYATWRQSFHSRTLYDAHPKTVFGDFSGRATFDDPRYKLSVAPFSKDGRFYARVTRRRAPPPDSVGPGEPPHDQTAAFVQPSSPEGVFEIVYAFGNRRHQPYVVRMPDGKAWVLPVYWDDIERAFRWDGWRPYVESCSNCHTTGVRVVDERGGGSRLRHTNPPKWVPAPADEGWAEGAVGCEVCHGPGRVHVETATRMGAEGYRAHLAAGGEPTIYDPAKDTPERRMQQCDTCHDFFSESSVTFVPGPRGYPHEPLKDPIKAPGIQFYENGVDMSPCTVGRVFRHSRMAKAGVECRDCHDAHGGPRFGSLREDIADNRLCLRCHEKDASGAFVDAAAVAAHARHRADGPGVLCVECHMPRDKRFSEGAVVMSTGIHSHAMSIPTGREDEGGGPRPACNDCHTDKDSAWTRRTIEGWKASPPARR